MNLHGVFLHILGDALASIAAITSGLLIEFVPWSGRYYFDPILSVLISLIIMKSAIPLSTYLKKRFCLYELMSSLPPSLSSMV